MVFAIPLMVLQIMTIFDARFSKNNFIIKFNMTDVALSNSVHLLCHNRDTSFRNENIFKGQMIHK